MTRTPLRSTLKALSLAAAGLILTSPAVAQAGAGRVTFTPFLSLAPPVSHGARVEILDAAGETSGRYEVTPGMGWGAGATLQWPVARLLDLRGMAGVDFVLSLHYLRQAEGTLSVDLDSISATSTLPGRVTDTQPGASGLGAFLGLGFPVPTRVPSYLVIAPGLMRFNPREAPRDALDPVGATYRPGLTLGYTLELPTHSPMVSFQIAIEDQLFLSDGDLERRLDRYLVVEQGRAARAQVTRALAHTIVLRIGSTIILPRAP